MSFISSFCCPYRIQPGLTFPFCFPVELSSAIAATARPDLIVGSSTGFGGPLAFPASTEAMVHRNWKVYSWDCVGTVSGRFFGNGYAAAPGPVDGGNPIIFEDYDGSVTGEFEELSPSTKVNPDFSLPSITRKMINWGTTEDDGPYPQQIAVEGATGFYPVYVDPEGNNPTGWHICLRAELSAIIEPYYWRRNGSCYAEHEISVNWSIFTTPDPPDDPPEGWNLTEGAIFTGFGGIMTSQRFGLDVSVGTVRVQDTTGIDPDPLWGEVHLFSGNEEGNADLTLRIRTNYLPIPDYS